MHPVPVLVLAALFGFAATDRWLSLPRLAVGEDGEAGVILGTVVAVAMLAARVSLG